MIDNKVRGLRPQKKILFVMDSLGCGGAERSFISLINLIDRDKYDIDVLLFQRGGVFERYLPDNIRFVSPQGYLSDNSFVSMLKRRDIIQLISRLRYSLLIRCNKKGMHRAEIHWQSINRVVKAYETHYDVAIAYQQGLPTYFVAEKVKANKKIAWINVDMQKVGYCEKFNAPFYEKYTNIVAVSGAQKKMLQNLYPKMEHKIVLIYDMLSPKLLRKMSFEEIGFQEDPDDGVRILTIGRMVAPKGYDIAIQAARYLKDRGYLFRWYAIGDGDMMSSIQTMVSEYGLDDYFILMGLLSNPYPYLRECDLYVQTSKFEGFGLTVSEAKIFNKPIVTTNFPSAYNQICDKRNGLIAEMNGEDIAQKIIQLMENKGLREGLIEGTKQEYNNTAVTELPKVYQLIDHED